jgi:hypothetical protein
MTHDQILLLVTWMGLITYVAVDTRIQVRRLAVAQPKLPLPIDIDNPPTKLVFVQGDGEPEHCACHGRPIKDGAEIWYWPQPAQLVCAKEGDVS